MTNGLSNVYYGWLKNLRAERSPEDIPKNIIALRDMFYASDVGKVYAAEE